MPRNWEPFQSGSASTETYMSLTEKQSQTNDKQRALGNKRTRSIVDNVSIGSTSSEHTHTLLKIIDVLKNDMDSKRILLLITPALHKNESYLLHVIDKQNSAHLGVIDINSADRDAFEKSEQLLAYNVVVCSKYISLATFPLNSTMLMNIIKTCEQSDNSTQKQSANESEDEQMQRMKLPPLSKWPQLPMELKEEEPQMQQEEQLLQKPLLWPEVPEQEKPKLPERSGQEKQKQLIWPELPAQPDQEQQKPKRQKRQMPSKKSYQHQSHASLKTVKKELNANMAVQLPTFPINSMKQSEFIDCAAVRNQSAELKYILQNRNELTKRKASDSLRLKYLMNAINSTDYPQNDEVDAFFDIAQLCYFQLFVHPLLSWGQQLVIPQRKTSTEILRFQVECFMLYDTYIGRIRLDAADLNAQLQKRTSLMKRTVVLADVYEVIPIPRSLLKVTRSISRFFHAELLYDYMGEYIFDVFKFYIEFKKFLGLKSVDSGPGN